MQSAVDRPGNDEVLAKEPCPECGSKNNLVRYKDGHAYCFSPGCRHYEPADAAYGGAGEDGWKGPVKHKPGLLTPDAKGWTDLKKRGLKKDTLRRYGYFLGEWSGKTVQVAPYYDQEGNLAAQKLRFPDKTFTAIRAEGAPGLGKLQLFGQHVYGERYDRRVIVTEGELDAMSIAQVLDFKTAVVSINTGAEGALRCIQANYRWLDRFQEIVLWFDDDEAGRKAVAECAPLFEIGKVKVAKALGFKDASAILQANKPGDIEATIYMAAVWKPSGVVNAADGIEQMVAEGFQVPAWPYPWAMLNERTLGMRPGEITYHVGGTGIAKTTLMFHYARHLMTWDGKQFDQQTPPAEPCKIGWFGFEGDLRDVRIGLLSIHAGRRLHMNPLPKEEALKLAQDFYGNRRLELYDPQEAEYGLEATLGYIKLMVKALGCKIIFLDPLTEIVSSLPTRDRTQAEDQLAGGLQRMARQHAFHMHIGYHLRKPDGTPFEEGGEIGIPDIKGSGALTHFSSNVFAYERDQQGERPDLLRIRALKVRWTGLTGEVGIVKYDPATGRYSPTKEKMPERKGDKSSRGAGGFGPRPAPKQDRDEFGSEY